MNKHSIEAFSVATMFAPNQILKTAAPDFLKDLDLTDDELLYLLDPPPICFIASSKVSLVRSEGFSKSMPRFLPSRA